MTDIFDGDVYLTLDADGAEITYPGNGQPIMDTGLENQVNLSQLTESGHWSEDLETDPNKRYSGLLLKSMKEPVTRQSLINMARAAELDAKDPIFSKIQSVAINPVGQQILISTQYTPVSGDPFVLRLAKNGQNYINQINNPAFKKPTSKKSGSSDVFALFKLIADDGTGTFFSVSGLPGGEILTGKHKP